MARAHQHSLQALLSLMSPVMRKEIADSKSSWLQVSPFVAMREPSAHRALLLRRMNQAHIQTQVLMQAHRLVCPVVSGLPAPFTLLQAWGVWPPLPSGDWRP